jgi:hypothetical protein
LEVSASAYYERAKGKRSDREIEDERLLGRIADIHERSDCAYGTGGCGSPYGIRTRRSAGAGCSA